MTNKLDELIAAAKSTARHWHDTGRTKPTDHVGLIASVLDQVRNDRKNQATFIALRGFVESQVEPIYAEGMLGQMERIAVGALRAALTEIGFGGP